MTRSQHEVRTGVLRGTVWRMGAQFAPLVVNLALTPFVISSLGRVQYGLWLVASTLTQFISQFDGGIGRSAQARFTMLAGRGDNTHLTRLLTTLLAVVGGITLLVLGPVALGAPGIARFFHAPPQLQSDTVFLLQMLVLLVGLGFARNLFAATLHAYGRYEITSSTILVGYVVYASGMVWALSNGHGLRGVAWVFLAQQAVGTLLIVPSALRHLRREGIGFVGAAELRAFAAFAWKVQVSGLLSVFAFQGVTLMVGRLAPTQMADYGPGATFAQQLRMMPMNAVAPIQTSLGAAVGADATSAPSAFDRMQAQWVTVITGLIAVGAPAAYFGVNIWLPLQGNLAGVVCAVLLVSHLAALLPQVLQQWLMLHGRAEPEMWSGVTTLVLVLGGSLVLAPRMGAMGVVWATLGAQVVGLLVMLWLARRTDVFVVSPLRALPWLKAVVCSVLSFMGVYGIHILVERGLLPRGGLGLILCGLGAAPALMVYLALTFGLRRGVATVLSTVRR